MAFTFGPGPAIDPNTGELITGATGNLYSDVAGTVAVTDATINSVPVSSAVSDSNGIVPQIQHATIDTLYWVSGSITLVLTSSEGLRDAALASAESAQDAASEAAEIATRTMQLKGNATAGVSFWGAFTEGTAPDASDGVAVGDLGVLLP